MSTDHLYIHDFGKASESCDAKDGSQAESTESVLLEASPANLSQPEAPLSEAAQMRREEIVAAAYEFYRDKGLSHTTIRDITEHIGVTRTLFYHYFPNKDALTSAVLDAYVSDFVELLEHWNQNRQTGDVDGALFDVIKILRMGLFEKDPFHMAMASRENAALYLEFVNRVADHTARYIIQTTVKDYADLHEVRITHLYETFYILIAGVIGYLRNHPDADDAVIADVIAQTLYMDRPNND